jgi:dihydroflavonol-4-reductase
MRALVTGGTGFVGGALVRALLARGEQVRVMARATSKTATLESMGVEIARGNILDRASIVAALEGCDTLFHAAALYDLWGLDETELLRTETEGTQNAMEAALTVGIEKVIYTSTAVAIGEARGQTASEDTPHRGYFLSIYEKAKHAAEQVANTYLDKGLPLITVNPAAVYGPGDRKPTGRFIVNLLNGWVPALFPGWMSLVYIDDAVAGHVLAADKGRVGERYILSGSTDTLTKLGDLTCRLAGRKPPLTIPTVLVAPYAAGGEALSLITRRPPVLSWETYRLSAHGFRADGAKATAELDLDYIDLEEGFTRTINWYWQQGLLRHRPACCKPSP